MERAAGGELFSKLTPGTGMSEDEAKFYIRQLLFGLSFLHSHFIAHRSVNMFTCRLPTVFALMVESDVKLENCLLDSDGNLKIVDYGLSAFISTPEGAPVLCQTDWSVDDACHHPSTPSINVRFSTSPPPLPLLSLTIYDASCCQLHPSHSPHPNLIIVCAGLVASQRKSAVLCS